MKVLVVYYSETKKTEKVAATICDAVSRKHRALMKKVGEVNAGMLDEFDLVFLGSPCHGGDLASPAKALLKAIPESPKFKLAGFFTHSCPTRERSSTSFKRWASKCVTSFEEVSKERNIDFRGYYSCQGAPSPPIQEFIRKTAFGSASRSTLGSNAVEEYIKEALKHPDAEDLCKAEKFACSVIQGCLIRNQKVLENAEKECS